MHHDASKTHGKSARQQNSMMQLWSRAACANKQLKELMEKAAGLPHLALKS